MVTYKLNVMVKDRQKLHINMGPILFPYNLEGAQIAASTLKRNSISCLWSLGHTSCE
jgi:hypothetical protein